MADYPITSLAGSSGASGSNVLLRFLSARIIRAVRNRGNPLAKISNVSGDLAQLGQVVGIPISPNKTAPLMTDGSSIVLDDSPGTTFNITLNRQRLSNFSITAVDQAMAGNVQAELAMDSAIAALLNGIEEDVMSVATASFTTNSAVGTYNTAITEAVISQGVEAVLGQRPPTGDAFLGFIKSGTTSWGALMQLSNFVQAQTILSGGAGEMSPAHGAAYGNGKLWHNTRWYMVNAMPQTGTSTDGLIIHPQAIAVAFRQPAPPTPGTGAMAEMVSDSESGIAFQVVQQWDGARQANQIVVKSLYGYGVPKEQFGVQVKS